MKKILLSFGLLLLTAVSVNAQIKEGHVSYKMEMTSDNPEMEMQLAMMQGSTLDLFFKEGVSRTEMKMGAMMTITTITDTKSDEMMMLMGGMMGNKAIHSKMSDLEKEEEANEKPEFEVELTKKTKKIAGYECKKAILTDEEGNESIFWYTEEIEVSKKGQNYLNEEVPGFPLEYELNNGGVLTTLTAISFEEKLDKKDKELFSTKTPEGYEEMTMEQLKSMGM